MMKNSNKMKMFGAVAPLSGTPTCGSRIRGITTQVTPTVRVGNRREAKCLASAPSQLIPRKHHIAWVNGTGKQMSDPPQGRNDLSQNTVCSCLTEHGAEGISGFMAFRPQASFNRRATPLFNTARVFKSSRRAFFTLSRTVFDSNTKANKVRPFERLAVRAARAENRLRRKGITKYNKRFRAWSQRRVRKFRIALPVVLTSDPGLMDAKYVTACMHKAAMWRKRDISLWKGYTARVLEIADSLDPVDWGYALWACGKAEYLSREFYLGIRPYLVEQIPHMGSSGLMSLLWCFKRIHYRDVELCQLALRTALDKLEDIRPPDFVKIANACASLDVIQGFTHGEKQKSSSFSGRDGKASIVNKEKRKPANDKYFSNHEQHPFLSTSSRTGGATAASLVGATNGLETGGPSQSRGVELQKSSPTQLSLRKYLTETLPAMLQGDRPVHHKNADSLRARLVEALLEKYDRCTAQEFRDAVNPVTAAVFAIDRPEFIHYLLARFRKIFVTSRPHHLLKAYETAVVCRVLFPEVWRDLTKQEKEFYAKLAMRHIPCFSKSPDGFHWNVSKHLSILELNHRNAFRWGPFWLDIGLESVVNSSGSRSDINNIHEQDEGDAAAGADWDRRNCILLDRQTAFYFGTNRYTRLRKLQHQLLSHLGWNVRHVSYGDWFSRFRNPGADGEAKRQFLVNLLSEPASEILLDSEKQISYWQMSRQIGRQKAYFERVSTWKKQNGRKVEVRFS
ncbi:unnamed protein product [Amoebophrya sp. A25]|nr:unnamed protein product [Amoebophrya sp. A25]|eukprot:GSA25T00022625001.1